MAGKGKFWMAAILTAMVSQAAYGSSLDTVTLQLSGAPCWGTGAPGSYGPNSAYTGEQVCTGVYRLAISDAADSFSGTGANLVNYANSNGRGGIVDTFCADLYQNAPTQPTTYQILNVNDWEKDINLSSTKAANLRELFGYFLPQSPGNSNTSWTDDTAAAFETCVWEIMNETSSTYDVSQGKGSFYMMGESWTATANGWLSQINSGLVDPGTYSDLTVLYNPSTQDYAMFVPGIGGSDVPEPVTLFGVLAGAVCAGRVYLQRRRAAKA